VTVGENAGRRAAVLGGMLAAGAVGPRARVTELSQMEGGWSRHSWALTVEDPDAGRFDLIVRVRPPGALLDTDLAQEYRTYALLAEERVPTPPLFCLVDADETPFGGPFFVMGRLPGRSPNVWRPRDREELEADWAGRRGYAEDLVAALATIHSLPEERLGGVIARDFAATLDHWQGVHRAMALVEDPVIEEAYAWARSREPDPVAPRLVHGDYRIGNCLIDAGRITGVLDWELSFVGDPRFDFGYVALDYHAGKMTKPGSVLLNSVAEREWFFDRYTEITGEPVDREVVRTFSVIGALMLSAILVTGIHYVSRGESDDIRLAWTRFALPCLRQDMIRLMGW
jgi:aminoglycoside phosphotransferase (APT) family kinase protein